ncbi:MAG: hypothetical protein JNN17_23365 [Verrucomicrobiaceae bacterium]|nr:hypothetical protein [Verrucomicrobiaceae bacterium]
MVKEGVDRRQKGLGFGIQRGYNDRTSLLCNLHEGSSVDCDCVVLAGDISTETNGLKWILRTFTDELRQRVVASSQSFPLQESTMDNRQ